MEIEWPELFKAADRLSGEGQSRQKQWFGGAVVFNILSVILAGFVSTHKAAAVLMFISMLGAVCLSLLLLVNRPQADWYNGRAMAESVKTLAWRFVTCTIPYVHGLPEVEAERALIEALGEVLAEGNSISSGLFPTSGKGLQITDTMRSARAMDLCGRRDLYIANRLREQQAWYSKAAKRNRRGERFWAGALVVSQCGAVGFAAFTFSSNSLALGAVGVITTVSSGIAAWQQQCQFGALASAYGMTAQELSNIQSLLFGCNTEETLSEFILSAERAISREHTYWLARRRHP